MPVTPEDEKLAVAALYLDTLALRSTKILPQRLAAVGINRERTVSQFLTKKHTARCAFFALKSFAITCFAQFFAILHRNQATNLLML